MGKVTCRSFVQGLLKAINFIFALIGLTMLGYGIYMIFSYNASSSSSSFSSSAMSLPPPPLVSPPLDCHSHECKILYNSSSIRRSILQQHLSSHPLTSAWSDLPSTWFLYFVIIAGGVIIFITSSGYAAAATANGCCLSCYSFLMGILLVLEIALTALIYVDPNWQNLIPDDATGQIHSIGNFMKGKVNVLKWVGLAIVLLQVFALIVSVILRATGSRTRMHYDCDDEYIAQQTLHQALLYRQMNPSVFINPKIAEGCAAWTDSWIVMMREKVGSQGCPWNAYVEGHPISSQSFLNPSYRETHP